VAVQPRSARIVGYRDVSNYNSRLDDFHTYQEKRNTLDSDVDEEKSESADVVGDVEHRSLHMTRSDLLLLSSASLRDQTFVRDPSFAFVQEVALAWACRHCKRCSEANKKSEEAFKEEDVAPRVNNHGRCTPWRNSGQSGETIVSFSAMVVKYIHSPCGQKSTERTSHTGSRDIDTDAKQKLVALVEASDKEREATVRCKLSRCRVKAEHLRHDAAFEDTKYSSGSQKAFKAVHKSCAEGDKTETDYKHG